jgi:hypothetical protein
LFSWSNGGLSRRGVDVAFDVPWVPGLGRWLAVRGGERWRAIAPTGLAPGGPGAAPAATCRPSPVISHPHPHPHPPTPLRTCLLSCLCPVYLHTNHALHLCVCAQHIAATPHRRSTCHIHKTGFARLFLPFSLGAPVPGAGNSFNPPAQRRWPDSPPRPSSQFQY